MASRVGVVAVLVAGCAGVCCCRVPTLGLWPEVDASEVRARLLERPAVVRRLCRADLECEAVEGVEVEVVPVGYNPLTGTVVSLVAVEATCRAPAGLGQVVEPLVCAGVVAAVGGLVAGGSATDFVTSDTLWGVDLDDPAASTGGGDWDWD